MGTVDLINLILSRVSQMSVQAHTAKLKKGKPTAHDSKIPQGRSRYEWVYTAHTFKYRCITVHPARPATHSFESHLCHEYATVCRTDSRVQCVRLTGCEQSTAADPYLVATMPSQGLEQETLERGGNSQGMLNISWAGCHSAW